MLNHIAPQTQSHDIVVMLPGGVPLELVFIPEGDFQMGSPEGEPGRRDYERLHRVRLTRPFFLGKFLVTQEQWMAVMPPATKAESPGFWARLFGAKEPPNPLVYPFCFCATGRMKAYVKGTDTSRFPAENINWEEAKAFCECLNRDSSVSRPEGYRFDLPTEAQWEYAARGGDCSQGFRYSGSDNLDEVGWYGKNSGWDLHPVGLKRPNELGLYDMSGNCCEWCRDWYAEYEGDATDPEGPTSGEERVCRSGCWYDSAEICRTAFRSCGEPSCQDADQGFRLALVSDP